MTVDSKPIPDFDAMNREFNELDKKRHEGQKMVDEAFNRMCELWGICSKHQEEFIDWQRKRDEQK